MKETPELKAARDNMEAAIMNFHRLEAALKGDDQLDEYGEACSLVITVFENEDRIARRIGITGDTVGGAHGLKDFNQVLNAELHELICMSIGVTVGEDWESIMSKAMEIMVYAQGLRVVQDMKDAKKATHQ